MRTHHLPYSAGKNHNLFDSLGLDYAIQLVTLQLPANSITIQDTGPHLHPVLTYCEV